jgi:hypothetical protein
MISCPPPQKPPSLDDQEIVCIMRFAAAQALSQVTTALVVVSLPETYYFIEISIAHVLGFSVTGEHPC